MDRLNEIKSRLEAASSGPWGAERIEDARFLAAAPSDIAYLLTEVERLRRLEAAAREAERCRAEADRLTQIGEVALAPRIIELHRQAVAAWDALRAVLAESS